MDAHGDGPPPTPDERARRDRRHIVAACVAGAVLTVPTLFAAGSVVDAFSDTSIGSAGSTAVPERDGDAPGGRDVEVPTLDLDELSGTDAEFGQLLTDVDRSEQAMLDAQLAMREALAQAEPDQDPSEALERVADAAGDGQRQLEELRSDVARPLDDDTAREVRDRYLSHLDAWVRYLVAIENDPRLLVQPDAEAALIEAIDTTGYAFAELLRDGLPDDLHDDVVAVAQAIADRGFPEQGSGGGDAV